MKNELGKFLTVACTTAKEAGAILREGFGDALQIEFKGPVDLVTQYDRRSEEHIISRLRALFPKHSLRAEESGVTTGNEKSSFEWLVDPLDGTTNFAHGFPFFAVSIALLKSNQPIVAAVFDPIRDELFAAIRGSHATLNGVPIQVSTIAHLDKSLMATGFPYDVRTHARNNLAEFNRIALQAQGVRRAGAAALDLCYTACGRLDGFWELRLHPWDMAAGGLIVQAAGGKVTDITGENNWLNDSSIAASNGRIHAEMLTALSDGRGPRPVP